jgi:hypothetical protein
MPISLPKSPTINIKVNEIGGTLVPSATSGGVTVKNEAITYSLNANILSSQAQINQHIIFNSGANQIVI